MYISPTIQIADLEIELTYARSSGPGGQNVNKVNSKAILRWSLRESRSLDLGLKVRLLSALAARLTKEGELLISCDSYRDQTRNREACFEKLRALVLAHALPPKPRRATRPTYSSKKKTLDSKRKDSQKKSLRRRSGRED